MIEKTPTLGSIDTNDYQKKQFAENSLETNLKDKTFCELFPDIVQEIQQKVDERNTALHQDTEQVPETDDPLSSEYVQNGGGVVNANAENNFLNSNTFANLCVLVGFALFAFTVNYVIKTVNPEDSSSMGWSVLFFDADCWAYFKIATCMENF